MAEKTLEERVIEVLDAIQMFVNQDGGDVQLASIDEEEGVVRLHLLGACVGCPMSTFTLKAGIERTLMDRIPEVKEVVLA